mgnify:CR=1 FL=1
MKFIHHQKIQSIVIVLALLLSILIGTILFDNKDIKVTQIPTVKEELAETYKVEIEAITEYYKSTETEEITTETENSEETEEVTIQIQPVSNYSDIPLDYSQQDLVRNTIDYFNLDIDEYFIYGIMYVESRFSNSERIFYYE